MSGDIRQINAGDAAVQPDFFTAPWGSFPPSALQAALIGLTRRTVLQRGKMRHKMSNWITGMGRPLDIRFRGLNYRIEGRNNLIEYGILTRPSYNAREIDWLVDGLPDGGVALDIGSNIGLYALPMAHRVGPQGRVLAIDANAKMAEHVAFHAAANGIGCITALTLAVGDRAGQVDLMLRGDDLAMANVADAEHGAITMRPLAEIVRDAGLARVDALKIDIEGHEDKALVPYFDTMPEAFWPRRIVIEFMPPDDYPGCAATFKACGYALVGRTRNNSMYERR